LITSFCFSKDALGNSFPPNSCFTGIQLPFVLVCAVQMKVEHARIKDARSLIIFIFKISESTSGVYACFQEIPFFVIS
jgi:hypothetical protein